MIRRHLSTIAVILFLIGWFFVLRPVSLGGPASYVMVSGVSMEPTLYSGDLVILQKQAHYEPGDIVAYRTSRGNIIHRIVEETPDGFVMLGDNKDHPDIWTPKPEHILGKLWLHLPGVGKAVRAVKNPAVLAALISGFAFFIVFWGDPEEDEKESGTILDLGSFGPWKKRSKDRLSEPQSSERRSPHSADTE